MMDAAAWIAEFARREQVWRDERQALWDRVGASQKHESHSSDVGKPVVLTPGEEIDAGSDRVPSSARRAAAGAIAAGWSTRMVASLAAVPTSGLVTVVTVRCRRHDERLWAAWRNGGFDVAWYVGPSGLERLGWARMGGNRKTPLKMRGVLDVIEGIRGPKQWVDLLERQELDRAIGVLETSLGASMIGA